MTIKKQPQNHTR